MVGYQHSKKYMRSGAADMFMAASPVAAAPGERVYANVTVRRRPGGSGSGKATATAERKGASDGTRFQETGPSGENTPET